MTKIAAPTQSNHYPERHIHCFLALDPVFASISDDAEAVGWSRKEVAVTLVQLAGANLERILTLLEEEAVSQSGDAVEDRGSKPT